MDIPELFLQRYISLYDFWLADFWTHVTEGQMRTRPHPRVNSIAWVFWHLTRVEDAGLNRFVADRPQVLDEGNWQERMKLPWRHNGNGMDFNEVDELGRRIDLEALHGYSNAVHDRTLEIVPTLNMDVLAPVMGANRLRKILFEEGWARTNDPGLVDNYLNWTKGKCLMNFGLTHPYQHVGEMGVIASLLGVEFE
ncbi:MAG TPA: DinB family protein [Anaerolineales bacterium]|nr:DinB family protein [Anaerolineales bacterium]